MGEGEAPRQKRKKRPEPKHTLPEPQSPHASKPLPAAPFLQTPTQSPAPGTPILEEAAAEAATRKRKMPKEQKAAAPPLAQNPTLEEEEQGEEGVVATERKKKKKKHKERKSSPSPSTPAAAETPSLEQEAKVTKKRRRSKDPGQTQSQGTKAPHESAHLPAAPLLEAPARSPAPGTSMLEEAAMRKREVCTKEQQVAALSLAQNITLEEQREDAMAANMMKKESKHMEHTLSCSSASVAAETPIWEHEIKVTKKLKHSKDKVTKKLKHSKDQEPSGYSPLPLDPGQTQPQRTNAPHASKPLPAAPAPSSAPGTPMLEQVAVAAVMRKRKICKEQKVATPSLAQNTTLEEQRENAMAAKMKEYKHMEHTLSSPSTSIAAETTIWEQEAKVNKKQKQRKHQEPSGKSPLPLDLGQTHRVQPQGGKAQPEQERKADGRKGSSIKKANEKRPHLCVLSKRELIREASKKQPVLPEGFVPLSDFVSRCTEQNPDHSSPYSAFFDQFRYNAVREDRKPLFPKKESKHMEHTLSCSSASVAAETPIWEQETKVTNKLKHSKDKVTNKLKHSKDQEPSGYMPLPLDPGQTQPRGTNAPHASKPLPAAPFFEAPARSPAPGTSMLEEAAMRKKKMCKKEQKVAALSLAQNTTLEEKRKDAMAANMMKKKESKHMEHTLSCSETPIWEQETKVTNKLKHSKNQEPSRYAPLPLDPGQTQPRGTNAPHASKPLPAAPFFEAPAPSSAPGTPMLEQVAVAAVMRKRKICKEQKVVTLSLAQNTTLEEQRENAMVAKMKKGSKHMEHTLSSPSTSIAAKTTIWEQEANVNKKQKQRKQQEPSGKSPLPLDLGQTHRIQSQGGKDPPEQEREADGQKGTSIKKSNEKRPRVCVLSKRELIKEASKKQPVLPEGFVPFSDFVSSCTKQNPDHSSKYSAFFDQFRYNPVREDRKPLFPKTVDRLARLPSRGHSSFESSQPTANETSTAFEYNIAVASKTKQEDSGSISQEKLNVEVKENSQKKTREKKQRKPSGNSLPDSSQTCCVQLTKAPLEQDQKADAPKVENIEKSNGKKARVHVPSKRKLFKEMSKEQMLPEGFLAPSDIVPNCTEQNPDYSSPSGASFHQFCYRPAYQDSNPQRPATADHLSMLPPRGYPSFELSELSANGTPKASKGNSSVARKSKKKDSGSSSTSRSQEKLHAEEMKNPEKKMTTKKQRVPPPLLTPAEKCSDKYRRVPLDQLVPPPRSPHNLLQENYASDPWKVIVICMLLNLTQGKQVKKIVEGFFEIYPDPQAAVNADPEKMAGYLVTLGLQHIKTIRIQKFSKEYVEKEWTYITELCGVGKYAADAYAIFCAGRATEVVPKDHKLVDYWNYVCFELPLLQGSQSVQEAGVTEQEGISCDLLKCEVGL